LTVAELATVGAAAVAIITAITALVVQTSRLIQIAEAYMIELRRANTVTETLAMSVRPKAPIAVQTAPPPPQGTP
jgi:hypothetical protein